MFRLEEGKSSAATKEGRKTRKQKKIHREILSCKGTSFGNHCGGTQDKKKKVLRCTSL
ncbi:unnamed protein product [Linum tenue]|uniref:Uncharacterized protein n=1 Tax=Linum tenue TaxID=586396 RepID=A0AAV0PXR3_9ROSI|nr:unnamed protein product [Linum tenue]